jgi:hypothetical protein
VIKGLVLGIAVAASITACATTGPRGRTGNQLTGTCAGVCDHYIECKSGHPEADRSRCLQECPEVFTDDDSRVGYESLTCADAVEYVDGSQRSART